MITCPKCGELNGDTREKCFKCFQLLNISEAEKKILHEEEHKRKVELEKSRVQKEIEAAERIYSEMIKINDLYEYKVATIKDCRSGALDAQILEKTLQEYSIQGWRVKDIFSNELGHRSSSISMNGMQYGTNATVDMTYIIFERCIRRYSETNK